MKANLITRTVKTVSVKALMLDKEKKNTFNKEFVIGDTNASDNVILKGINKSMTEEGEQAVAILDRTVTEKLYAMTEADFIKYAFEMDKDNRKQYIIL